MSRKTPTCAAKAYQRPSGLPAGVHKHWNKYHARISYRNDDGLVKTEFLGSFDTPESASIAYQQARESRPVHKYDSHKNAISR